MNASNGRRSERGFSLVELLVIAGIILVVAVIAIPQVMTATQAFRLRGAASGFSGAIQKCRMLAVSRNARCPGATCSQTGYYAVTTANASTTVFVDLDGSGTNNQAEENATVLQLPASMIVDNTGTHPSDAALKGALTAVETDLPHFNARGLPCFMSSGSCSSNGSKLYISYIRQDRAGGGTGWAAISVTPAGRVRVWTWDGSNWQ